MLEINNHKQSYFYLFADCFITVGANRATICDLLTKEVYFIPADFGELTLLFRQKKIGAILALLLTEADKVEFENFIRFLIEKRLGTIVEDISLFPPIEIRWESSSQITNAIIDIETDLENADSIFNELDQLNCNFVQLRCYTTIEIGALSAIIGKSNHKTIRSIEIIAKYNSNTAESQWIEFLTVHPIISVLYLHSSPENGCIDYDKTSNSFGMGKFFKLKQEINSCFSCGVINMKSLLVPNLKEFMENKLFNSCLNRKISIDVNGEVRNCPSMSKSFGNIARTSLTKTIQKPEFKKAWLINKDKISVCKDCEYRYMCTDCRAYVETPEDNYSKPLKCGYSPYTNEWEAWSTNPLKQKAIGYYNMQDALIIKN